MESLFEKKTNFYYELDDVQIVLGDSFQILTKMKSECVDMIFADPPYFLSNGGITCRGGKWFQSIRAHGINLTKNLWG